MKSPLRPGDPHSLGGYELLARLGEGGMGSVFLGRRDNGPLVAIKIIKAEYAHEEEFRGRFRSEVKRARQVPPFCTAAVLDADPEHRTPYLVVEYVDGPSLDEVVTREGPLADSRLHGVAVGVATALTAIHGAGVIHRDLKPRNVLFALGSPKVIDFGIARALEVTSQHTHPDQMVGTVAYMAPERFDGIHRDITPAADVFAWGAVIAYAGTGRTPFRADSPVATAARILTQPPELTGLSGSLADLVALALSKDPEDRPTAHELLNLLLAQNTDPRAISRPPTLDPRLREAAEAAQLSGRHESGGRKRFGLPVAEVKARPRRRRRTVIAVTAAATVLMAGVGLFSRGFDADPAPSDTYDALADQASMPVPGAVRGPWVVDALDRRGQWKAGTDGYDGRCSFKDGLVMSTPASSMLCPGTTETFAGNQSISATITLTTPESCAEIQFRATGDGSYWLDLCPQIVRIRHQGAVQTTTLGSTESEVFTPGRRHAVVLLLSDEEASVRIDDEILLDTSLTDPSLVAGKVAFGVAATDATRDDEVVVSAVVARAEIRPIGDAYAETDPSAPVFTDVRKGKTKSIVKVRGYFPKTRSIVVEPVLFMTGDEYCRTFALEPSPDAPCEQAWVTEDSRMLVTLPTTAAPKLTSTFDDPEKCAGDPVTVGTCTITADRFATRLGTDGLAQVTTVDGVLTGLAEVYTP
ncbi:serine/threonine-protein kinase [Actinoplanes sp. NPDC026670]|uniref:serine/threonine protein kinase n=1 Tax=Actinoplanes sp. NPDC026670 TaxID=3154700 RepID=UPI0033E99CB5